MNSNKMDYNKAKNIVRVFLFTALALCIIGLFVNTDGSTVAVYFVVAAIVCTLITLFIAFTCLKCPYCGTRIIKNCLRVKVCPFCHRELSSGLKVKKKKSHK